MLRSLTLAAMVFDRPLANAIVAFALPAQAQTALWARLQAAELPYFVLMRHTLAPGTGDPATFQLNDCTSQRNLSAEGQAQATAAGETFRNQDVEVDRILASQWCRCLETATLMALGEVEPYPDLNSFFRDRSTEFAQTEAIRSYMVAQQNNPGVTLMVTHFVNITALTGTALSSGGAVVLLLNPEGSLEVVGELNLF